MTPSGRATIGDLLIVLAVAALFSCLNWLFVGEAIEALNQAKAESKRAEAVYKSAVELMESIRVNDQRRDGC